MLAVRESPWALPTGRKLRRVRAAPARVWTGHSPNGIRATDFVRRHIVDLQPYTPIIPFEVLSGKLSSGNFGYQRTSYRFGLTTQRTYARTQKS